MRKGEISRETKETTIKVNLNLDEVDYNINTEIGFFNHMLTALAFHGNIGLDVLAKGDMDVCDHHQIEDVGIAMGQAFLQAIGDRKGIVRYGSSSVVMDEALAQCDLDISNRPYLVFNAQFKRDEINGFACEMVKEFFYAFAINARITLHINLIYGENDHHKIEAIFKAVGQALRKAIKVESDKINSTKGVL